MDFIFDFNFTLFGCKLDFVIKDSNTILNILSDQDNKVILLQFTSQSGISTLVSGKVKSKGSIGFSFIEFILTNRLSEALIQHKEIENLTIGNKLDVKLSNRDELIKKGYKQYELEMGYKTLTLCKKCPNLSEEDFTDSILVYNKIQQRKKYIEAVEYSMYWLDVCYSVSRDLPDLYVQEVISKYRLLWTAFNPLYDAISSKKSESERLKDFAKMDYSINYFNNISVKIDLKQLVESNLVLRNGTNVSKDLEVALMKNDVNSIAEKSILCLYAIRNSNIHGDAEHEKDLCRVGFELLNPLIKLVISKII